LASVIVQVYVPAAKLLAVADVPPDGDHEYVYPDVPPVIDTVAAPLLPPLHDTLVCDDNVETNAVGCVNVATFVLVHALASVMIQVYVPAAKPVAVAAVPPDGAHEYVYPGVPPVADTDAAPLLPPLHAKFVCDDNVEINAVGCVKVTVFVVEQAHHLRLGSA
jgi:hypothetical protein